MKAALFKSLQSISTVELPKPKIGPGELLIRVKMCGVCGTDIKKLQGPALNPPLVLGHEVSGVIVEKGEGLADYQINDRVVVAHHVPCFECHYCRHQNFSMCRDFKKSNLDPGGYAEFLRIPKRHVPFTVFKLPDSMSDESAIFTEPLACCVRAIKRLSLLPGDTVVLVGFGSIGILLHALLKRIPVDVWAVDLDDSRLELARETGAQPINPNRDNLIKLIHEKTQGRGADCVLFTAGKNETLEESLNWVRDGGTLCLFADLAGEATAKLDTLQIYKREITLNSSYSPSPEDLKEAFHLLRDGEINLSPIKIKTFGLGEIPEAISSMLTRQTLKAAIVP